MGIFNGRKNRIDEATKIFKTKLTPSKKDFGEGYEDIGMTSQSLVDSLSSFNLFNDAYINKAHENETAKIQNYRSMARAPEVSDVVEDAVIESTQTDEDNRIMTLQFVDEKLGNNENTVKTLKEEFDELFFNRLKIGNEAGNMFHTYFVDGRYYMERVGKNNVGITDLKLLPTETMDFKIGQNGRIEFFVQYLNKNGKLPLSVEDGEKDKDIVVFYPSQISYVNSGMFGKNRKDVIGYLEKCKQPYNQLKLLETAVIIYRIIRAPERLVFKIDTGSMPRDRALKFVEKIKRKFQQRESYDPSTGQIINKPEISSLLENFFLPQCLRLNTSIPLLNGKEKTLYEIINDYNNGIKNEVYSVDQKTGKPIKGEVEGAGITRKDAELIRVGLDNDEYIDVTPDHKFVLRDGKEKEAQNLQINDSLMPYYTRNKNKLGKNSFYKILNKMGFDNYTEFKKTIVVNHKIKKIEKLNVREDTGCLTIKDPGDNHNFAVTAGVFVKNSSDGRGSDIQSIGGNFSAFSELDDIYFFQRKLYRSLKYPMSRVTKMQEGQEGDIIFAGGRMGEITRDEIKGARFLERQQNRITYDLKETFLLHLELKGLKKQYELDRSSFEIEMTPPNQYKDQLEQILLETKQNNYSNLSNEEAFPKTGLMNKMMHMDEDEIKDLKKWHALDKEVLPEDTGF